MKHKIAFYGLISLLTISRSFISAQTPTPCDLYPVGSKVVAPSMNKTIVMQSAQPADSSFVKFSGTQIGQVFKATAPYLQELITNFTLPQTFATSDSIKMQLYVFDCDNNPKHRNLVFYKKNISASSWNNTITIDQPIRLKPGLKYYLAFDLPVNTTFKVDYDYNPEGQLYVNGERKVGYDLDINIKGAYPTSGYSDLQIYNYMGSSPDRNFQCHEIGQTFVATAPYLNKLELKLGGSYGSGVAKIYEFDESRETRTFKQVGESCIASISNYYSISTFDWIAKGLTCPFLKVGKKYYVEITKQSTEENLISLPGNLKTGVHVYASLVNGYLNGDMYVDGVKDMNGDLFMTITGFDPNAKTETMVNTMDYDDAGWLAWYPVVGQTFKATTSYLMSVGSNFCQPNMVVLNVYKYSGNMNNPKGNLLAGPINVSTSGCGIFKGRLASPIPLVIGEDYYVEFSSTSGNISIYGKPANAFDQKYFYGKTFFNDALDATYILSTMPGPSNFNIEGLNTGMPYIGWGVGINPHMELYNYRGKTDSQMAPSNTLTLKQQIKNTFGTEVRNKTTAFVQIGAQWTRFSVGLDDWFPLVDCWPADTFFNYFNLRYSSGGGNVWNLGFAGDDPETFTTMKGKQVYNWANSNRFYGLANDFADKAAFLAERYKGFPIIWEVLNEPFPDDNFNKGPFAKEFSCINPRQYDYLVKLVSDKIKKVDPTALVAAGAYGWYNNTYSDNPNLNIGDYIDLYSFHGYFNGNPESGIDNWLYSRKQRMAMLTKSRSIPSMMMSEFGTGQYAWNTIYDSPSDPAKVFKYNVQASSLANSYNIRTNVKSVGQIFKSVDSQSEYIKWIKINIGSKTNNLAIRIYEYKGTPQDPKGKLLCIGTKCSLSQTNSPSPYTWVEFNFENSAIVLKRNLYYYLELYSEDGQDIEVYGTNQISECYVNDNTVYKAFYSNLSNPSVNNYIELPGSLNMKIKSAGYAYDANLYEEGDLGATVNICGNVDVQAQIGVKTAKYKAIYDSRYLLNLFKRNVPLSALYKDKDADTRQGYFYASQPGIYENKHIYLRKPCAIALENIYKFFNNAFSDVKFDISIINNTVKTNYVARYDEKNKILVIALWKNIAAESDYTERTDIRIANLTSNAVLSSDISVNMDIVTLGMVRQCSPSDSNCNTADRWYLDQSTSNLLYINNVRVGSSPIIVTIKLP